MTNTSVVPLDRRPTHTVETALLELRVANREHFVDEQDRRFQEHGDREAEPHLHPARVELDLPVDRDVEFGELDDRVEALQRPRFA